MRKKIIKYSLLTIVFMVSVFLYLIYFGQNRFSLMLNQGLTTVPSDLSDIVIEDRRGLFYIMTQHGAKAQCKASKHNLSNWLKDAEFQVIYFSTHGASHENAYGTFSSLPASILKNDTIYSIQFESGNPKTCIVTPLDNETVSLSFVSGRN